MSDNISRKAAKDAIAEKVFHDLTDEFYGVTNGYRLRVNIRTQNVRIRKKKTAVGCSFYCKAERI